MWNTVRSTLVVMYCGVPLCGLMLVVRSLWWVVVQMYVEYCS